MRTIMSIVVALFVSRISEALDALLPKRGAVGCVRVQG